MQEYYKEILESKDKNLSKVKIDIARKYVLDTKHIYTGVIYQNKEIKDYYSNLKNRKGKKTELVEEVKNYGISNILNKIQ